MPGAQAWAGRGLRGSFTDLRASHTGHSHSMSRPGFQAVRVPAFDDFLPSGFPGSLPLKGPEGEREWGKGNGGPNLALSSNISGRCEGAVEAGPRAL